MKPFRDRNPVIIGIVGTAVLAALILAAFRADQLPLVGGGDTYYANFSEIGALKTDNEVRVAGVSVGKVTDIELNGDHVEVEFRLDQRVDFGVNSKAKIKVKTLLGAEYLALQPDGGGQFPRGGTIPVSRTEAPYDVVEAFSQLSETTDQIDIPNLADALDAISEIAQETPEEFQGAIKGVSKLSANLAARDQQINDLLVNLKRVTSTINSRNDQLEDLFADAGVLFDAVSSRRDQIHELLVSTTETSKQLRALAKDTRADLKPTLDKLNKVTTMLRQNESSLDEALRVAPAFMRVFANALGTGPWFDTYLSGIPPNLGVADQLKKALGAS